MWVKICGNTNLEDAQLAADLGADAVGFVFAPSLRQVTPEQVAQITPHLPASLEKVGVFPAWPWQKIADAAREAGLTGVQLHGGIDLSAIRQLHEFLEGTIAIIPVLSWQVGDSTAEQAVRARLDELRPESTFDRILIDSKVGQATGGTGISFDWTAATDIFHGSQQSLILAGGLRPENVRQAIRQLNPWGVDVSSGVEASPGRKDPKKVASFIQEARAVRS
jgi:phosphoribosylanthranilate isomerase